MQLYSSESYKLFLQNLYTASGSCEPILVCSSRSNCSKTFHTAWYGEPMFQIRWRLTLVHTDSGRPTHQSQNNIISPCFVQCCALHWTDKSHHPDLSCISLLAVYATQNGDLLAENRNCFQLLKSDIKIVGAKERSNVRKQTACLLAAITSSGYSFCN